MQFIYAIATIIFIAGLYMIITATNYIMRIFGLSIMQNSILIFYIAIGKVVNGIPPIYTGLPYNSYSSPVTHVLMLTAIVVGFATTIVAIAITTRIQRHFDTTRILT